MSACLSGIACSSAGERYSQAVGVDQFNYIFLLLSSLPTFFYLNKILLGVVCVCAYVSQSVIMFVCMYVFVCLSVCHVPKATVSTFRELGDQLYYFKKL